MKELAKATAAATDDIRLKIEGIQHESNSAVAAISRILEQVKQISDVQLAVAGAVEEQTVTTSEIGRSVELSATGSTEITRSIVAVTRAAQDVTAGATDAQNAASELAVMAAGLRDLVGRFRYLEQDLPSAA